MAGEVVSKRRTPCDDLVAFVDGKLSDHRAEKFRRHLLRCEKCCVEVPEAMQLAARLSTLKGGDRG